MIVSNRVNRVRRPRQGVAGRLRTAVLLALIAWFATPSLLDKSEPVTSPEMRAPEISATLSYSGGDPIITGSVAPMFHSVFSGPNRAGKRDRARPRYDAVAFARSFEEVREKLGLTKRAPQAKSA